MIKIEIQHFEGCPNSQKMISNTNTVIIELGIEVECFEVLVETAEKAMETKFRGSPTLIINGSDFESLEEPESPNLACRYYHNGIPSKDSIKDFILTSQRSCTKC